MAVYLPITPEARDDAKRMIRRDLRSPANGDCTLNPSQDLALGLYWLHHFGSEEQRQTLHELVGNFPTNPDVNLREPLGPRILALPPDHRKEEVQRLQTLLFSAATQSGLSFGVFDFPTLPGAATSAEVKQVLESLDPKHPLSILYQSKARGSLQTFTELNRIPPISTPSNRWNDDASSWTSQGLSLR